MLRNALKKSSKAAKHQLPTNTVLKNKKHTPFPPASSASRSSSYIRYKIASSTPSSQKKADGVSKLPLQIIDIEDLRDCRATDANMTNAKMDAEQKVVLQVREKDFEALRTENNKVSRFCISNAIVVYTLNCLYIQDLYCILFYMLIIAVF